MRHAPRSFIRRLHSTPRNRILVGPSDPVSNLRPVIYDELPAPHPGSSTGSSRHPYSLREFTGTPSDELIHWKLERQRLDAFNQKFWTDSNTRFEAGKNAVLSCLPETATALVKEQALSEFYKHWVMQESHRTEAYTKEWSSRNFLSIITAARIEWRKLSSWLGLSP